MNLNEVREDRLVLGRMSPEEERALVAKNLLVWDNFARAWEPAMTLGNQCWDYLVGNILTEEEKAEARAQYKLVLQIPELVNKVNALEGMQIAGRRDGIIIPVGGEDSPDSEAANTLLKSIQRSNSYEHESTMAFTNALVTSYPSCMWFDQATDQDFNRKIVAQCEPWNAVLYEPFFRRQDMQDADSVIRIRAMSMHRLQERWPERAKLIESQSRIRMNSAWDSAMTSADRDQIYNKVNSSNDMFDRTGLIYVVQRCFFIMKRVTVWVSSYSSQPEILPPDWTKDEIARWRSLHPNYQPIEMPMRILWETITTSSGVLLENKMHWFQENEFPCEIYIPRVWNGKFYGLIEFLRGSLKGQNVSFMERIHSVRLANNDLMVMKEGAVVNAKDALNEKARPGGVLVRSKTSAPDDIQFPLNHPEQKAWSDLTQEFNEQINRLSVDRNFEGGTQSSQESGKVVQLRNAQSQVKYSPHMSSYNIFHLRSTRKMLMMVPYVYTEPEIIRHVTKEGQVAEVAFNDPQEYNPMTGAVIRVKNNLCGIRFDYVEAEGDNSVTAKEHELNVFNEVLNNLKAVQDISAWPPLLLELPNRMAQDFGRRLQAALDAKANQGPGIEPVKISVNARGEDFLHNPILMQTLQSLGVVPEQAQTPEDGGMPPNAVPFPQGEPAQYQPQTAATAG